MIMEKFDVLSSSVNDSYKYVNDNLIVLGDDRKDGKTGDLVSISGNAYEKTQEGEQGAYIGVFNGYMREDGEMHYSLSEMSRAQSNLVWDAIEGIEAYVMGTDENAES